ncbi:MAG: hypothetical protein R3E97_14700 [Candidatus Eisenbacteria bacterium]
MTRPLRSIVGIGIILALFATIRAVGLPAAPVQDPTSTIAGASPLTDLLAAGEAASVADASDSGDWSCAADVDLPLQVEIVDPPSVVSPGTAARTTCRFVAGQDAERVELEFHPIGVTLVSAPEWSQVGIGAREAVEVDVEARLDTGVKRGTVDVLVRAWIDGRPYERGATWNLSPELPERGDVVERPGRLPVREVGVGRVTR